MVWMVLAGLANPVTWLIAVACLLALKRLVGRATGKPRKRRGMGADTAALGAAFQFFSIAYRPNHAFVARAQIEQQEDADEDEDGGPDTPVRRLHRQLKRIRRGEPVDTLVWRLE